MRSFADRNVNGLFRTVSREVLLVGEREESRNGPVRVYPTPVVMTYTRPWERCLFSPRRRANPFFHLFESFWMLGGREDATFLNRYVSDFGARFAEAGGTLWGAYGHRWRKWGDYNQGVDANFESTDQLEWVIDLLLREPQSRRAVIQMYDPEIDSLGPSSKISPKDIPCNTTIYLRLRPGVPGSPVYAEETPSTPDHPPAMTFPDATMSVLDLTVCCRSNDLVWGTFGANAVHFTVLQEYLAWRLDARMGSFHQLSNNLHVYDSTAHMIDPKEPRHDLYATDEVHAVGLFHGTEPGVFEEELGIWLEDPSNLRCHRYECHWPFLGLLIPMSQVHDMIRDRKWSMALEWAEKAILAPDWRRAAQLWIETRRVRANV